MTRRTNGSGRLVMVERALRAVRWISLQAAPFDADAFAEGVGLGARVARRHLVTLEAAGFIVRHGPSSGAAQWTPRARLVWL